MTPGTRRSSMTSFAFTIEPAAQPRLAAGLLLVHVAVAGSPWFAGCPPWLAVGLTVLALGGFAAALDRVPGPHCRLRRLVLDADGWKAAVRDQEGLLPATIGNATRVYPALVCIELVVGGHRHGWLLPCQALDPADFRRLKARLRLT